MFDAIDLDVLNMLQSDGRVSNAEMARQLDMAPSAVLERTRKLERRGAITGYEARLAPENLGLSLLAFVFVRANELPGDAATGERLAEMPEVLEVHHVAGEDCYLVKVRTANPEELGKLLRERVGDISTVTSTKTTIVLGTVKETASLPLPASPDEELSVV